MGIKVQVLCPGFVHTNFHYKQGISPTELQNRGIVRWMMPDEVVKISVKNLHFKNRVVIVPGIFNKIIRIIYLICPKRLFYCLADKYMQ